MNKKYQIFISSTYEDLKNERQQAIKAILEMGHIPVGMEMFSVGDETQWQLIKRQIDDCDYYIIIVAHRYGSVDGNISYTEKEYNYAIEKEIPVLAFIINDKSKWQKTKIDMDVDIVAKLNLFKEKLKSKIIDYWSNSQDLKGKVSIALIKQMNICPRIGWMKANNISDPDVLNEISRLSKENAELRQQLNTEINIELTKEEQRKDYTINLLNINKILLSFFYKIGNSWENTREFAYSTIFNLIAPELQVGKSTSTICGFLGRILNPETQRNVREHFATPSNTIKTIMTDFSLLGLTQVINPKKDDGSEVWEITNFGKEIYALNRLKLLEKNYPKNTPDDTPSNDA